LKIFASGGGLAGFEVSQARAQEALPKSDLPDERICRRVFCPKGSDEDQLWRDY
jgi:hypothetical protein